MIIVISPIPFSTSASSPPSYTACLCITPIFYKAPHMCLCARLKSIVVVTGFSCHYWWWLQDIPSSSSSSSSSWGFVGFRHFTQQLHCLFHSEYLQPNTLFTQKKMRRLDIDPVCIVAFSYVILYIHTNRHLIARDCWLAVLLMCFTNSSYDWS